MSFAKNKQRIEEGDTVILYYGFDNLQQVCVNRGHTVQSRYGALKLGDLIGTKFGCKVQCSKGFLYVLHPTPELWTLALPHRTQILYSRDISMVTLQLDLKPGSIVIESGTGSASLSHALIRTIAPTGHLHTFDFHEQRSQTAKEEFKAHGIGELVTCYHRDVCNTGFGVENLADAVFLDLPLPWDVIPYAKEAIRPEGGRICSFSPCIEQVQRTCEALRAHGFTDITTMEVLARNFDVRTVSLPVPDLGWGAGKFPDSSKSDSKLSSVVGKIEFDEDDNSMCTEPKDAKSGEKATDPGNDDKDIIDDGVISKVEDTSGPPRKKKKPNRRGGQKRQIKEKGSTGASLIFKTGTAPVTMPGHTGYLTFASLYYK